MGHGSPDEIALADGSFDVNMTCQRLGFSATRQGHRVVGNGDAGVQEQQAR